MTFDWNKPFQARDGRKARRVSDKGFGRHSNIIIYDTDDGCEGAAFVTNEGWNRSDGTPSPYDLVNIDPEPAQAPTPITVEGFDPSKTYAARNGDKAEILGTMEDRNYGAVFIVRYTTTEGKQWCGTALFNGQVYARFESNSDLVNVKPKRVGYIGLYPRGFINDFGGRVENAMVSALYETEGGVPEILHGERLIKIVPISWEE